MTHGNPDAGRAGVPRLTAWGASADADLVYRLLVTHGPSSAEAIHRELGLGRHRVAVALDELADGDAVHASRQPGGRGADARTWHPRPPERVVAALRERRRRAALDSLKSRQRLVTLAELDPDLRVDADPTVAARPLHGLSRARARLGELVDATRHEHLSMHPEPAFDRTTVQASASLDHDLLARNVKVLSLGVPPSVEDITAAHTLELTHSGMQYRELPTLPAKMILFDRRTVIVPMDPFDLSKGALEVVAPNVAERLSALFLRRWSDARPPGVGATVVAPLTPRERRIIALLAAGHTDAGVAARLRLSERTIAHVIRGVMERHGVQNRFQLGLVLGAAMTAPTLAEGRKE